MFTNFYGHHFMMYVSQIIMPYTLNLYSAVYQLYLNNTKREKLLNFKNKMQKTISMSLVEQRILRHNAKSTIHYFKNLIN